MYSTVTLTVYTVTPTATPAAPPVERARREVPREGVQRAHGRRGGEPRERARRHGSGESREGAADDTVSFCF